MRLVELPTQSGESAAMSPVRECHTPLVRWPCSPGAASPPTSCAHRALLGEGHARNRPVRHALRCRGPSCQRRSPCVERAPRVHDCRIARCRVSGVARPGAQCRPVERLRVAAEAGHSQPCPIGASQRWFRARPGDRDRRPGRGRTARSGGGRRPVLPGRARTRRRLAAGAGHGPARRGHAAGAHRGAARLRGRGRARPPRSGRGRIDPHRARARAARRGAVAGRAGSRRRARVAQP